MSEFLETPGSFNLSQPANWRRVDENDDGWFYQDARLVVHVDDHFIATLGKFYGSILPPGGRILDLMSSFKSHLPADYRPGHVTGLGMNEVELRANRQLDDYVVQNLNREVTLPFEDQTFDAVLNCVSIQYVQQPLALFGEVGRVLKPGGWHIVSFSNRMFPTKAVQIWRELDDAGRVALVRQYFGESGLFDEEQVLADTGQSSGRSRWASLFAQNDPVFIVYARRK